MVLSSVPRVLTVLALTVSLSLSIAGAATSTQDDPVVLDEALIREVIELLEERFVDDEKITNENLTIGAVRGIVEALGDDGHTEYLTREEFLIEQQVLDGRVVGIGVVLDQRSRAPVVISVVDGSPASRAGLRAGDIIVSVDDIDSARLPLGELADLVAGDAIEAWFTAKVRQYRTEGVLAE